MLALNPENRPTFERVLSDFRNTVFPDYFYTFLADYVVNLAADHNVPSNVVTNDPIAKSLGQADSIILGIYRDWAGMLSAVLEEHKLAVESKRESETISGEEVEHGRSVDDNQGD